MINILLKDEKPIKTLKDAERVTLRLDAESSDIIRMYCEQEGVKTSEAIRRGISKLKECIKIKE